MILCGSAHAETWDSGPGLNWAIPDITPGISWNFQPNTLGQGGPVTQFDLFFDPKHTWIGDLTISVSSPDSSTVNLWSRPGFTGTGFGNSNDVISVFYQDDGIPQNVIPIQPPVDSAASGLRYAPYGGPLSNLTGPLNGMWTLTVRDDGGGDIGTIDRVRVLTTPVPEATSLSVALIGLTAFWFRVSFRR